MASLNGLGENARKDISEGLSRVLADTYTLYLKTHNFHWNVEGPRFRELHLMFEEQYTELATAVDDIAERIRALGCKAPGSYAAFSALGTIKEADGMPDADEMVRTLAEDHGKVIQTIRNALPSAQEAGDEASVGMMVDRLTIHEKTAWMLRASAK